ncbi:Transcriptional regulator, Crp/Fnr family [hydrothermal vent metagenome]|uniref:Transcriptional regulator, Crp/Fnr family n=1 Tax=hydrothermal vent metagenome TaxID=652676 RepID=A0A3B1AEK0_9ZZZZ
MNANELESHMNKQDLLWSSVYPELSCSAEPVLQNIMKQAGQVSVPAGSLIISPGTCCEHYLFVVQGQARVHVLTENGREVLLYYVGPSDSCVLTTSCLLSHESFPAGIVAETDLLAFTINASLFEQAIDQSSAFRHFVFKKFGERLVDVVLRMEQISAHSIDRYLAKTLLELAGDKVEIITTHQDLAVRLGTAREVVSRHLKTFETNGWVSLARGYIRIANPEHLKLMAL